MYLIKCAYLLHTIDDKMCINLYSLCVNYTYLKAFILNVVTGSLDSGPRSKDEPRACALR